MQCFAARIPCNQENSALKPIMFRTTRLRFHHSERRETKDKINRPPIVKYLNECKMENAMVDSGNQKKKKKSFPKKKKKRSTKDRR